MIVQRCAPASVDGVDPSEGQLAFARTRPASRVARFKQGDAMALPYADKSFDVAVMALVIFFVPDPTKGVAEMVRVVRPGGSVAAYAWDMRGGGFPWEPVQAELRALGQKIVYPPSVDASRIDAMRKLWTDAGMTDVETREITVQRTFDDLEDFLSIGLTTPSIGPIVRGDAVKRRRYAESAASRPDASGCKWPHHVFGARQCGEGASAEITVD